MPYWQVDKDWSRSNVSIPIDSIQAGQTIIGVFLHSHLADRLNDLSLLHFVLVSRIVVTMIVFTCL